MNMISKRTDFFAPSKTLQDAKNKLGPLYYNAKLVECPQNAVELTKLLQEWNEIDKQKYKAASESKREQRKLLLSLNKKHRGQKSSPSIDRLHEEDDVKLPPPGFRFHTNGEPKAKSVTEIVPNMSPVFRSHSVSEHSESCCDQQLKSPSTSTFKILDANIPTIDYEEQIKVLETVVHEIEDDLASVTASNANTSKTYLRAHSKSDVKSIDILPQELTFSHPNERFAFQPGASTFGVHVKHNLHKRTLNVPSQAKCIACQFKLKHSSADFKKLQSSLNKPISKRWQIAPRGKYTDSCLSFTSVSPTSSARLSMSKSPRNSWNEEEKYSDEHHDSTGVNPDDIKIESVYHEEKPMGKTKSTPIAYRTTSKAPVPRGIRSTPENTKKNNKLFSSMSRNVDKLGDSSELLVSVWSTQSRRCTSASSDARREKHLNRLKAMKQQLELEKEDCTRRVNHFLNKTKERNSENSSVSKQPHFHDING